MKRLVILMVVACLLMCTPATADDLGVQIIGSETVQGSLSLDDMQLGERYDIDGYARVLPLKFEYKDYFLQYNAGAAGDNTYSRKDGNDWRDTSVASGYLVRDHELWSGWAHHYWYFNQIKFAESGSNADFGMLYIDLVNMHMAPHSFMADAEITVVFNEDYSFVGWVRQYNDDYVATSLYGDFKGTYYPVLQPKDEQPINMIYTGRYIFGCTLPDAVVNGDEPLRMEIKLGDSELVYHIRK